MTSLLAREVFVSTMTVVLVGTEDDPAEDHTGNVQCERTVTDFKLL